MTDFGDKPELGWLRIDSLYVDQAYQRSMATDRSLRLVERIFRDFRWAAFGAILVAKDMTAPPGQQYAILDGQHRTYAAKKCGIEEVPCIIIECTSLADKAKAFLNANRDRVAITPFGLHHAAIAAGDAAAMAVHRVCLLADVEIPKYPLPRNRMKARQTMAISTIKMMVRKIGEDDSVDALRVLRRAFPEEVGALAAPMIRGVYAAMQMEDTSIMMTLIANLRRYDFAVLERMAQDNALDTGRAVWLGVRDIVRGKGAARQ